MTGPRHRRRSDPEAPLVDLADVLMDDEIIERLRVAALSADACAARPPADLCSVGVDGVRRSPGRHRARITPSLPPVVAPVVGDEVFALLQEWRSEITTPPLPPLPVLPAAVRSAARRRRWSTTATRLTGARSVRPALAISGALAGLLFGSAVVSAKEATPEQPLFALTTIFWPQEAASKAALGRAWEAMDALSKVVNGNDPAKTLNASAAAREALAGVEIDDQPSDWDETITKAENEGKAKQAALLSASPTTTTPSVERRARTLEPAPRSVESSPARATSVASSPQAPASSFAGSAFGGDPSTAATSAGAPITTNASSSPVTQSSSAGGSTPPSPVDGGSSSGATSAAPTTSSPSSGDSTTSPAGQAGGANGPSTQPSTDSSAPPSSTTPTKTASSSAQASPATNTPGVTADSEVAAGSSAPTPSAGVPQASSVSRAQPEAPPAPAPTPPPAATPDPSTPPAKGSAAAVASDASAAASTSAAAGR